MAYKTLKTNAAFTLEAQAETTGSKIVLTQMALGDGGGQAYDPDQGQTALRGEKARVTLNTLRQKEDSPAQWSAEGIFPADAGGFTAREAGLFTEDGTLFAVASIPPVYRPTAAEGAVGQFVLRLNFVPANAENITISIDPTGSLATQDYVQNYTNRKIGDAVAGFLPLTGGTLTGNLNIQGTVLVTETFSQKIGDDDYDVTQPIGAAFWDMQCYLQLANNKTQGITYGKLVLRDNGGNYTTLIQGDNHGNVADGLGRKILSWPEANATFLPLSGGQATGEIGSVAKTSYEKTLFGGILSSAITGFPQKTYLQLQGKVDNYKPAIVFFDGKEGFKTWIFDPATGKITDPNNQILATIADLAPCVMSPQSDERVDAIGVNPGMGPWVHSLKTGAYDWLATQDWARKNLLQLPSNSPPLKIQAFRVSSGPGNGSPRISFPEAFSQTLSVSAIVNQTPNSGTVSRTVNILPNNNSNDMRLDNWGFNCQIFYALGSGGTGTTGDPWTMLVTAIGVA